MLIICSFCYSEHIRYHSFACCIKRLCKFLLFFLLDVLILLNTAVFKIVMFYDEDKAIRKHRQAELHIWLLFVVSHCPNIDFIVICAREIVFAFICSSATEITKNIVDKFG